MPFENLTKPDFIYSNASNYAKYLGASLSYRYIQECTLYGLIRRCYENNGFLEYHSALACALHCAQQNDSEKHRAFKEQVFREFPENLWPILFDDLYTIQLIDVDLNNLSMSKLAQIVDTNNVGSGYVLIDLALRNWDFLKSDNLDPEIIYNLVDLIPQMLQKLNTLRKSNPSSVSDNMYISDFYPKVPFYMQDLTPGNNKQMCAAEAFKRLLFNIQFAMEVLYRAAIEMSDNAQEKNESFWKPFIQGNYSSSMPEYCLKPEDVEATFIHINGVQHTENPDTPLLNMKFALNMARNLYNCYKDPKPNAHFDFVTMLVTSEMSRMHTFYVGAEQLTGNYELRDLIHKKLSLENNEDGNAEFSEFIDQISIDAPKVVATRPRFTY